MRIGFHESHAPLLGLVAVLLSSLRHRKFATRKRSDISGNEHASAILRFSCTVHASYDKDKLMNEASFTEGALRCCRVRDSSGLESNLGTNEIGPYWQQKQSSPLQGLLPTCRGTRFPIPAAASGRSFQDLFRPKEAELSPEAAESCRIRWWLLDLRIQSLAWASRTADKRQCNCSRCQRQ